MTLIKINRINQAPLALDAGLAKTANHISAFLAGAVDFGFDELIYGCAEVKNAMREEQHNKCCYCEKKINDFYADVEHFRPKKAIKKPGIRKLFKPGYFWLAYDWGNLLVSCEVCNRSHKKNQFPLLDESAGGTAFTLSTALEEPLLICPLVEDPETLIGFRDEYPFALNGDVRAAATIKTLKLDRDELSERRRSLLEIVKTLKAVVDLIPHTAEAAEASDLLRRMQSDEGEFASCVRSYLNAYP